MGSSQAAGTSMFLYDILSIFWLGKNDFEHSTDPDNRLIAQGSYFRHAENTFVDSYGATFDISYNHLDRCYYGLTLRDWAGTPNISFKGNFIESYIPITSQPIPPNAETQMGVRILNYESIGAPILTIGDEASPSFLNFFAKIHQAVYAENSDVRIVNNYVSQTTNGFYYNNTSGNTYFLEIGGNTVGQKNTLMDVAQYGIYTQGRAGLSIEGNHIEGGTLYGILLNQTLAPTTTAKIWRNSLILGKRNSGGNPIHFEAIYINSFRGNLSIRDNTIETKLHNGVELAIGRAILVGWTYNMGSLEIRNNIIRNTLSGIFAYQILAQFAYIESNDIRLITSATDYGNFGIYCYNNLIGRKLTITDNYLENYDISIYVDHSDNTDINDNTIMITALPVNLYNNLYGIHLSNSGYNTINNNYIDMANGLNTSSANIFTFRGIIIWDTYNLTSITRNNVLHTEYGLWIYNDAYPSYIACNTFDYSNFGVCLSNAWHGLNYGNNSYEIGIATSPNNNQWYNELDPLGRRITGTVQTPGGNPTWWWYKNGTPFTLASGQYQVIPAAGFFTLLTNDLYDICNAKSSSSQFLTIGNLSEQDFLLLSAGKKDTLLKLEFHHLDSLVNYSPSTTSFILPNNTRGYEKARHSYAIMMKHPWVLSGNISATGTKYNSIKNFIASTNIHSLYVLDTLANEMYLPQLNSALAAFTPQNQVEQNAATYYAVLKNYLNQHLVLTAADSAALLSVALQNANTGGFPVYKSRSMLGIHLIDSLIQAGSANATIKQMSTLALKENPESPIYVYPNPATDMLFVVTEGTEMPSGCFIEIYAYTGKLMKKTAVNNNTVTTVPVNLLDQGFYFYRIVDQNKTLKSGKLIIQ
jgi:hypothetical protein